MPELTADGGTGATVVAVLLGTLTDDEGWNDTDVLIIPCESALAELGLGERSSNDT